MPKSKKSITTKKKIGGNKFQEYVKGIGEECYNTKKKIDNNTATDLEKDDFPERTITFYIFREILFEYNKSTNNNITIYSNELRPIALKIIPIAKYLNIDVIKIFEYSLGKFMSNTSQQDMKMASKIIKNLHTKLEIKN